MATWTSRSSTRQQINGIFQFFPFDFNLFCRLSVFQFSFFDFNLSCTQALQLLSSKTTEQKLQWAFRLYDEDNSGLIDKDEMANIMMVTTFFIMIMTSVSIMMVWQHDVMVATNFFIHDNLLLSAIKSCITTNPQCKIFVPVAVQDVRGNGPKTLRRSKTSCKV